MCRSTLAWRLDRLVMRGRRPPIGTTFSFGLDTCVSVTFSFSQKLAGHKLRGAGAMTLSARPSTRTVRFAGRVSHTRKLRPGAYVVSVTR
jgi:hypothetical protein